MNAARERVPEWETSGGAFVKTSEHLIIDNVYTRDDLKQTFKINDATINTGIFRPKGYNSVWLFITKEKTGDRIQYEDRLVGDDLYVDGQKSGHKDKLLIDSAQFGIEEILLFYRKSRYEFDGAGFRYEGLFQYVDSKGQNPRKFHLRRISPKGRV